MDRFLGSVTTRIGLVTSPSIKIRSPPGPIISTSLPGPTLSHTGHTGASPSTTTPCSPCTVLSARNNGKYGKLYAPVRTGSTLGSITTSSVLPSKYSNTRSKAACSESATATPMAVKYVQSVSGGFSGGQISTHNVAGSFGAWIVCT